MYTHTHRHRHIDIDVDTHIRTLFYPLILLHLCIFLSSLPYIYTQTSSSSSSRDFLIRTRLWSTISPELQCSYSDPDLRYTLHNGVCYTPSTAGLSNVDGIYSMSIVCQNNGPSSKWIWDIWRSWPYESDAKQNAATNCPGVGTPNHLALRGEGHGCIWSRQLARYVRVNCGYPGTDQNAPSGCYDINNCFDCASYLNCFWCPDQRCYTGGDVGCDFDPRYYDDIDDPFYCPAK